MPPKEEQYGEDDVWGRDNNSMHFFQREKLQVGDMPDVEQR